MTTPPATDALQQTWSVFQQTFILAARVFESATARFGLSYPQAAVLKVLRECGRPLPLSQVARLLTQEAQSTTELADRLERRGYVRRIRDPRDRRLVLLELTDEGQQVVDQIIPSLTEAGAQLFGALDPAQTRELVGLLLPLRDRAADQLGVNRDRLRTVSEVNGVNHP